MTICNIADIRDSVINEVERTGAKHAVFDLYGTLVDIHTDEEEKNFWKKPRQRWTKSRKIWKHLLHLRSRRLISIPEILRINSRR